MLKVYTIPVRCAHLFPLLVVLVLGTPFLGTAQTAESGHRLYRTLVAHRLLERQHVNTLEEIFRSLLKMTNNPSTLNVNKPYDPSILNVYVMDLPPIESSDFSGIKDRRVSLTVTHARNNALALPPDIIVFDIKYMAGIMVNAWNEQTSYMNALIEANDLKKQGKPQDVIYDQAEKWGVILDIYRLDNIRNAKLEFDPETTPKTLLPQALEAVEKFEVYDMLTFAIAPVFFHELGHLRHNTTGLFWDQITDWIKSWQSGRILEEEERADRFAAEMIEILFHQYRGQSEDFHYHIAFQAVVSTIKYLRDIIMLDLFSGFRGLEPEDYFSVFLHWDCAKKPGTEDLLIGHPDKVAMAFFGNFPLLTAREFSDLRSKYLKAAKNRTHAHHFLRGDRILNALRSGSGIDAGEFLDRPLLFLRALRENNPLLLYDEPPSPMQFSLGKLVDGLNLDFQSAATCSVGMCLVGFRDGDYGGFLEVVGTESRLSYLRLMLPLFRRVKGNSPVTALGELHSREATFLSQFFVNLMTTGNQYDRSRRVTKLMDSIVTKFRQCGTVYRNYDIDGKRIIVNSITTIGWISVEVFP